MSNAVIAYVLAALLGVLVGWEVAVALPELYEAAPRDNPGLWMLFCGIGSPVIVWLFLRSSFR